MSQSETIARPYAKAIYRHATVDGNITKWQNFLQVSALIVGNSSVEQRLSSPGFYTQLQTWIDESLLKQRQQTLSMEEKKFIDLLYENDRLSVLPEIAEQYECLLNVENNTCSAKVYTAQPLTDIQEASIKALLKKKVGQDVVLEIFEQVDLLAGVRIEYNGLVLDQSTKGRMEQFARKLDDLRN